MKMMWNEKSSNILSARSLQALCANQQGFVGGRSCWTGVHGAIASFLRTTLDTTAGIKCESASFASQELE
eukprot:1092428-Amphidinium_carterae.1